MALLPPEPGPRARIFPKIPAEGGKIAAAAAAVPAVNAALRYGRRAAAFALVFLTLSFSCLMTVDAAFRERVIQVVVQVFQDFTEFVYTSDSPAGGKPGNLVFTYLPEGMEEQVREQDELGFYVYMEDLEGEFIELDQSWLENGDSMILGLDTENAVVTDFVIRGVNALGIEKGLDHTIHWTEGSFVYTLSGTIPLEELKLIAEGIQTVT